MLPVMTESRALRPADACTSSLGFAELVTTRSTRILEADASSARMLKRAVATLVQKPLAALVDLEERPAFRSRLSLLAPAAQIDDWHLRLSTPDGKNVGVIATVAAEPTEAREGRLRWTLVLESPPPETQAQQSVDGSTYLELERELGQLAHDLNQPLAAIVTFVRGAQLRLRSGKLSEADLDAALETIAQEALRANAIARDLGQRWRIP
jgi:signal transduction histidine kinase